MSDGHVLIDERIRSLTVEQEELSKQYQKQTEDISNFIVRQADNFAEFRLELLKEIRSIERSIASKCEQDSAIIMTQNRELTRVDRVERDQVDTAKALAVVTENMKNLEQATADSLRAAHDELRGHKSRIAVLEKRGGKLAIKVLYAVAGIAATAAITWWITSTLERLAA